MDSTHLDLLAVKSLLRTFYSDVEQTAQIQGHLIQFQHSACSWPLLSDLILDQDVAVSFFGANTLQVKIKDHLADLRSDEIATLWEQLLLWASKIQSKTVACKLWQCLCALASHVAQPGWVLKLLDQLKSEDEAATFDFLTILCQEQSSSRNLQAEVKSVEDKLLQGLCVYLKSDSVQKNEELTRAVYRCCSSFIPHVEAYVHECYTFLSNNSQRQTRSTLHLLEALLCSFQAYAAELDDNDILSEGSECLEAILDSNWTIRDAESVQNMLYEYWSSPTISSSLQQCFQHTDQRISSALLRAFCNSMFAMVPLLVLSTMNPQVQILFQYQIAVTAIPVMSEECDPLSIFSLPFWVELQEYIFSETNLLSKTDQSQYTILQHHFGIAYKGMRNAYRLEGEPTTEKEGSRLEAMRTEATEAVQACGFVLRDRLYDIALDATSHVNQSWQDTESALWALSTVVQSISSSDERLTGFLLYHVQMMQDSSAPITLIQRILNTLNCFSHILAQSDHFGQILSNVLLVTAQNEHASQLAANTFRTFCLQGAHKIKEDPTKLEQLSHELAHRQSFSVEIWRSLAQGVASIWRLLDPQIYVDHLMTILDSLRSRVEKAIAFVDKSLEFENVLDDYAAIHQSLLDPQHELPDLSSKGLHKQQSIDAALRNKRYLELRKETWRTFNAGFMNPSLISAITVQIAAANFFKVCITPDFSKTMMSLDASEAFSWIWACIKSATSSAVLLSAAEAMLTLVPRDQSDIILQIMIITQRRFWSAFVGQDVLDPEERSTLSSFYTSLLWHSQETLVSSAEFMQHLTAFGVKSLQARERPVILNATRLLIALTKKTCTAHWVSDEMIISIIQNIIFSLLSTFSDCKTEFAPLFRNLARNKPSFQAHLSVVVNDEMGPCRACDSTLRKSFLHRICWYVTWSEASSKVLMHSSNPSSLSEIKAAFDSLANG